MPIGGLLKCNRCGELKPTSEFYRHKQRKCGFSSECKICVRPRQKAYYDTHREAIIEGVKKWGKDNPEKLKVNKKRAYERNREEVLKRQSEYVKKNATSVSKRQREWRDKNADKLRAKREALRNENPEMVRDRERRAYRKKVSTPEGRVIRFMRSRIWQAVVRKAGRKSNRTLILIGCTTKQLKAHIESLWLPGMTWENYGLRGWHIDHIKPCAAFDLTDAGEQTRCFHYTNLQPLWASDNLKKADSYLNN